MMKNAAAALTASINMCLVRRMSREYDAAIRAEENAPTEAKAWRAAKASERALRRLQAAQAGLPLPVAPAPRTAKNLARGAFAALAMIGRAVARALATEAALRKAQAVGAARRAARAAARLVRQALRRTVRTVARLVLRTVVSAPVAVVTTNKEIVVMKAPTLAARITVTRNFGHSGVAVDGHVLGFFDMDGPEGAPERFRLGCWLIDSYFVFRGGPCGEHRIAADVSITSAERLLVHWQGYCDNTVQVYAAVGHRQALRRTGHAIAVRVLAGMRS